MARYRLSVRQHHSATRPNSKWVLDIRYPNGKRERRYFATKEEAVAEQSVKQVEVENLGLRALEISDRLRMEALDSQERLAGYGVTLIQVVDDYIRRRGSPKTTVREVADIYLKSRIQHGRSKKHLDSLRRLFERFCVSHGTDRINDMTGNQVEEWLHDLGVGPVTINTYRALLHSLFEFGVRKKLCPENPVKAVERMTVKAEEVGILTPDQLAKLLKVAQGDVRATVALGAFAGIRPEEIVRLTWEEVSLEKGHITITAAKSKTAQHRYVKILPCLEAWLRPLIGTGSIQGGNFRRRYDEARRLAGFALRGNKRRRRHDEDKGLVPWPHDALRHSFASYHLAKYQNAPALALELGHQSNALIFSNYRRRVTEAEANEYFNLMPQ
jgi:integrase